jgi:hypothetical protein
MCDWQRDVRDEGFTELRRAGACGHILLSRSESELRARRSMLGDADLHGGRRRLRVELPVPWWHLAGAVPGRPARDGH